MATQIQQMTEGQLVGLVQQQSQRSLMHFTTEISTNIKQATRYYYGEKFGNEVKGKSAVVSRDVGDAVDWIMPSLMRIFGGSDKVCEFEPTNEKDEQEAEQATDYINYLYNKRNNGFTITYQFIKDILLNKNGILKISYNEVKVPKADYFSGLDQDTLNLMLADDNKEPVELVQLPDGTFNAKINTYEIQKQYRVEVVPPEEFLIHPLAKDIDTSDFTAHRKRVTKSELRQLGYDEKTISQVNWNLGDMTYASQGIFAARHSADGPNAMTLAIGSYNGPGMERAWYTEAYMFVDFDGDGIAELRRVCVCGNVLLSNDEWDVNPFVGATSTIVSHKFYGLSLYDKLRDIQEIKSTLIRNMLDNIYNINHGRYGVLDGQVNLDDLLKNSQNGVVRMKMQNAILPLPTPALPAENFQMLSYLDSVREDRSGVSKTSQGLDANILHSNQSANAVNQVMTAAQQQVELIARVIAETGFKPLFRKLYALTTRHQDADDIFRLRGKFIKVSPSQWRKERNVSVTVGLGNHNKDQQLVHLQNMWNVTQTILSQGGMNILTSYDKIYNLLAKISENSGYPDFHKYWLDPASPQGQQGLQALQQAQSKPKPDEIKANAEAQTVQVKAAQAQSDAQLRQQELAIREREVATKERELLMKEQELEIKREELKVKKFEVISDATLTQSMGRDVAIGTRPKV